MQCVDGGIAKHDTRKCDSITTANMPVDTVLAFNHGISAIPYTDTTKSYGMFILRNKQWQVCFSKYPPPLHLTLTELWAPLNQ